MRSRIIFLMCFVFALTISLAAQTKMVTNADLESYRQQRLDNEKYYLENYQRLGLPSPEEINRRNAESAKTMTELSMRLRAEAIERVRIDAERIAASRQSVLFYRQLVFVDTSSNLVYGNFWRNRRYHFVPHGQHFVQPGYFAGGQFWPTGSARPSLPMFTSTHH